MFVIVTFPLFGIGISRFGAFFAQDAGSHLFERVARRVGVERAAISLHGGAKFLKRSMSAQGILFPIRSSAICRLSLAMIGLDNSPGAQKSALVASF
jgi:hypothetical protein